jgi:hypothetical protein
MSATLIEVLTGILKYFPNTIIATLFVAGILLGRLSWIFVSLGGIVVAVIVMTLQYVFSAGQIQFDMMGKDVIDACSILPDTTGTSLSTRPSIWMALTFYFATFIFTNAVNIYTQKSTRTNSDALSVQQRKGTGIVSMVAVLLILFFVVGTRIMKTTCEPTDLLGSLLGIGLGAAIGIGLGIGWWFFLNACGSNVYPDIHGVMIGTQPGILHRNPIACA